MKLGCCFSCGTKDQGRKTGKLKLLFASHAPSGKARLVSIQQPWCNCPLGFAKWNTVEIGFLFLQATPLVLFLFYVKVRQIPLPLFTMTMLPYSTKNINRIVIVIEIEIETSKGKETKILKENDYLQVLPFTWTIFKFTKENTELIVFGSEEYDEDEYIRDHDEFLELIK